MAYIPYNVTPKGISFVLKGSSRVIPRDHANYDNIKKAVLAGDVASVETMTDIVAFIAKVTNGDVKVSNDQVRYKDGSRKVPMYMAERILENVKNNEPIEAICRMLEKLMLNPNQDILEDLFKWVEVGNMPIHEDGDIVAFKKVQGDYYSVHTGKNGKLFQKPGTVCEMPREDCDENRNSTCSTGLHFCSYDYLSGFGSGGDSRVIIVKINPKDITAIPTDYNNTKGRCCRFEVIDEVPEEEAKVFFTGRNVYSRSSVTVTEMEDLEDDNSDDDVKKLSKPKADVKADTFVTSDGREFSYQNVRDALAAGSLTDASKALSVARSTLGGWKKKLGL